MCVCIYAYIHTHIYIYIYIHTHTYIYINFSSALKLSFKHIFETHEINQYNICDHGHEFGTIHWSLAGFTVGTPTENNDYFSLKNLSIVNSLLGRGRTL